MTAANPQRRKQTARELAERFSRSPRTIRRVMAEPRADFESRAAARHDQIRELRDQGLTMRAIAEKLRISVGTVHYALHKNAA